MRRLFISGLCIVAVLALIPTINVFSQSSQGLGQGLELSPPRVNLTVLPGETKTFEVRLLNVTGLPVRTESEVNDFIADGEEGIPKLLLNGEESTRSLKNLVANVESVELAPKEAKTVQVTVDVPTDQGPGGYYGVVRFNAVNESDNGNVSLSASVGTVVLLEVPGTEDRKLTMEEFSTYTIQNLIYSDNKIQSEVIAPHTFDTIKKSSFFSKTPFALVTRLKNTGNVHEQPKGAIVITNMFGKQVSTLEFSDSPKNILPDSIRRFEHLVDTDLMPGRYTVETQIFWGEGSSQQITATSAFWIIPIVPIVISVIVLIALVLLLTKGRRAYNRSIIEKAKRR